MPRSLVFDRVAFRRILRYVFCVQLGREDLRMTPGAADAAQAATEALLAAAFYGKFIKNLLAAI